MKKVLVVYVDIKFQQKGHLENTKGEYKRTHKVNSAQKENLVVVFYLNSELSGQ